MFRPARPLSAFFVVMSALPLLGQEPATRVPLTFEQTMGGDAGYRPQIEPAKWSDDGRLLKLHDGSFVDPLTGEPAAAPEKKPAAPSVRDKAKAALAAARDAGFPDSVFARRGVFSTLPRTAEQDSGMVAAADGQAAAVFIKGELWAWSADGGAKLVRDGAAGWRRVEISPKGRWLSFIRDFNLHLLDLQTGAETAISKDGGENLFYGELDWVYQEEVYGRGDFKATWWSPADKHLAWLRIDESGVPQIPITDDVPHHPDVDLIKYPKAGDTNPRATLHLTRAADGARVDVDLGAYKPEDEILIVRVAWNPAGDRLLFQVQDREQRWLDLCAADPDTGKAKVLIHETSESWVNVLEQPRWLRDGTFLWESERTGYRHLYHYDAGGKLLRAVTSGEWQVQDVIALDEERGFVDIRATKDGAIGPNVYRAKLDGSSLVRLTQGPGSHAADFNHDRTLFLDVVGSTSEPPEQRLCKADGGVVRVISKASIPAGAERHGLSLPELVRIPARDGYGMDATIVRPFGWSDAKTWPVWIDIYGGPDHPDVRNSWSAGAWNQFLAQEGFLVLDLNVRSASGRGQVDTAKCYQQFGVQELMDLEDAVAWTIKNHAGDAARVGVTGWSYGGFVTAYALTHSKAFRLGIAGAGVYDWKNYDTIYTERYMRTPQNNPEGYKRSSCVEAAKNLHGHLLLVHGTIDDNVHLQNTMQFAFALQRANKSFEMMLYPKQRHGVQSRHLRELQWKTMREHLLSPAGN